MKDGEQDLVDSTPKGPQTTKRVNVIFMVKVLVSIAVAAIAAAAIGVVVIGGDKGLTMGIAGLNGALGIAGIIGAFGDKLIALDSAPFDAQKAAHEAVLTKIKVDGELADKRLTLDHEHRNAENLFRRQALEAAGGAWLSSTESAD